jgi:hypothetical protein
VGGDFFRTPKSSLSPFWSLRQRRKMRQLP